MSDVSKRTFLASIILSPVMLASMISRANAATGAVVHEIHIGDFEFTPDVLQVRAGDKIRWINHDLAPHTATAKNGSWDTGELMQGKSATITVVPDMTPDYFCEFHPHMEGRIKLI